MKALENLNEYKTAYKQEFKFHNEDLIFLTHYAKKIAYVIHNNKYKSILSLGIGQNVVSDYLIAQFGDILENYTLLEGSKEIVDEYASTLPIGGVIHPVHTYFEEYNSDEKFDVLEMGFVLEHVDDPLLILKSFKKFLKPSGTIFVAVPNARSLHRQIGFEAGLLDSVYRLSNYDLQLGHKRYFDLQMISSMVLEAGFKIKNTTGLLLKPITTGQMQQLNFDENIINALLKIGDNYPDLCNCVLIEAAL